MPTTPPTGLRRRTWQAPPAAAARLLALAAALAAVALAVRTAVAEDAPAAEAPPEWQAAFDEQFKLAEGENAKLVEPPFTAARNAFHRHHHQHVGDVAGQYALTWKDGKARRGSERGQWSWSSDAGTVASALQMAGINLVDIEGLRDAIELPVPGDWIIRAGAERDAILADIRRELTRVTEGKVRIEPAKAEKDVIVARGRYRFKRLAEEPPREPDDVHLFTDKLDPREGYGGGVGSLTKFLRHVGRMIHEKVIDETDAPGDANVSWSNNRTADDAKKSTEKRDLFLKNLAAQTSLEFRVERRKVEVWRVIDESGQAGGL